MFHDPSELKEYDLLQQCPRVEFLVPVEINKKAERERNIDIGIALFVLLNLSIMGFLDSTLVPLF